MSRPLVSRPSGGGSAADPARPCALGMVRRRLVLATICLGAAACGGADADTTSATTTPATTSPAASSTSSSPTTSSPPTGDDLSDRTASTTTSDPPTSTAGTPTTMPPSCVEALDLASAAALLVWPAAEPSAWGEVVDAVENHGVGGVILMGVPDWSEAEIAQRLGELEAISHHGLVVATDEEGGDVQRLRTLGTLGSQRSISREFGDDTGGVRKLIADHGRRVRATGVDVVFGPVVDVEPESGEVPLAPSRFFVGGPDEVADLARAYVDGWSDAGLVATLKHFPGHGAASGDTHDVDGVTPTLDELAGRDLVPYERLGDRAGDGDVAVMIGHLTVPGLTDGRPATQSPEAVALLRSIAGYADALLITDALGMAAVDLDEPAAAVAAVAAGIDVALFTRTTQTGPVIDALVDAVEDGTIDEESLRASAARVMSLLERDGHTCDSPAIDG